MSDWRIIDGDCRDALRALDAASVHTCVTSPPYFGLRDYGHDGQIGLEPTPDEFVAALVGVFREVRRVLRDDGTVWLNLGDSYAATSTYNAPRSMYSANGWKQPGRGPNPSACGAKPKDLIGIPWLVAFALRADGWYLRSEIIWHKPNPMPESVTDRPTKSHEQVFLLSKSPTYYYDADAIREDPAPSSAARAGIARKLAPKDSRRASGAMDGQRREEVGTVVGEYGGQRNRRSVWTIATQPYAGAHFATFPPKLIEPCILAGCPERCCAECGAPWERVVERTPMVVRPTTKRADWQASDDHARTHTGGAMTQAPSSRTVGFEPSCDHDAPTISGTVLDPFAGAGTTGMVALRHGRSFTGIELNPGYAQLARDRIETDQRLGYRAPKRVTIDDGQASIFDALDDAA